MFPYGADVDGSQDEGTASVGSGSHPSDHSRIEKVQR